MSATSVIQHHPGTRFIKLREDYLALCEGNHCQALLLDILEEWTNTKLRKQQSPAIYMTYPQWIRALHGLYGRNAVIKSLATLEQRGLLSRHPYTLYGKETFSYQLQVSVINQLLMRLAEPVEDALGGEGHACHLVPDENGTHPKEDGTGPAVFPKRTAGASQNGCNVYPLPENTLPINPAEKAAHQISKTSQEIVDVSLATAAFSPLFPCIVLTEEELNLVCSLRKGGDASDPVNIHSSLHETVPSCDFADMDAVVDGQRDNVDRNQMCMASSLSHLECSQVHQVDSPSAKREAQPAETVVRLIEELRGHPYPPAERSRELKAAFTLLNLKEAPHLGLEEIREAWEHGSDDWWRATYGDDVHVHDLIRRNKRGVRWVLAFLDHKRKENRKPSTAMEAPYVPVHEILSSPPTEMSETYEFLASEAEAVALASRIERDGQVYGYAISAHTEEDEYHPGIWYVQIEWWIDAERMKTHRVSSWQAWERYILQQHKILQYNAVPA